MAPDWKHPPRRLAATLALVTTAAMAVAVPGPAAQAAPAGPASPAGGGVVAADLATLAQQARFERRAVPVPQYTTETQATAINPDGTTTVRVTPRPARVRQNGRWVALDPTLKRQADGSYRTVATPSALRVSGGGSTTMATLTNRGDALTLSLPMKLPTPKVSGSQATYPNLLPGVDLVLTADEQGGLSHVLVVRTAKAASNPALASLTVATSGSGLTLATDPSGNITASNRNHQTVFTAPTPQMWDSATTGGQPAAAASASTADAAAAEAGAAEAGSGTPLGSSTVGPGRRARTATVATSVDAKGGLRLTPDRGMLTAPDTRWPVYIDPTFNPNWTSQGRSAWGYVESAHKDTAHYNGSDVARTGYNGWASPYYAARSYFLFPVPSGIWGTRVLGATLQTTNVWSGNPDARTVYVYHTCAPTSTSTWNSPPCVGGEITHRSVPGNWRANETQQDLAVDFDVTGFMQGAANNRNGEVGIGLFGDSDTDKNSWRKWKNNPTIAITYNSPPEHPHRPHHQSVGAVQRQPDRPDRQHRDHVLSGSVRS